MSIRMHAGRARFAMAALLGMLAAAHPAVAHAQVSPGAPILSQDLPEADFLFGPPRGAIGLRGSLFLPSESSDLFDFVRRQLTIDKGDFRGAAFAADVAITLSPRLDVVGGVELARKAVVSEYRDFVDDELLPIQQQSLLRQNAITGSLKFLLLPRGRRVGRFVWIPARVQPFVGTGGGVVFWKFEQSGDFVDFQDFGVFTDTFSADGVSPSAHVLGGVDIQVYKRLMFTLEGRYLWAHGTLGGDFIDFEPLDLSGFRVSAGINFVF